MMHLIPVLNGFWNSIILTDTVQAVSGMMSKQAETSASVLASKSDKQVVEDNHRFYTN